MTDKEKAKAYDKAYRIAESIHRFSSNPAEIKRMEQIFPELAESEDEKIRKHLIKHFRNKSKEDWNGVPVKSVLFWLEKQGSEPNWCHHKVDLSNCSEEYRKAYYDGWNNCNMQHSQCKSESNDVVKCLINGMKFYQEDNEEATWGTEKFSMKIKDILFWLEKQGQTRKITHEEICKSYGIPDIGEFSDGYHTFNGLYKQRMILFAVLVKTYKDRAWKSWKHEDGLDCFGGGWFIVGIDTPAGTYTYHYEAKDWDRFDCKILDKAKHWDGHDESDVERLFSLLEKQGGQKPFDYENANIQQKDFAPKSAMEAIKEEKVDNANKVEPKDYSSIDPHFGKSIEQKPTWSEEDERILVEILKIFNIENFEGYNIGEYNEDALKFLKSIKGRVQPQPKQEWSEEDEATLTVIGSLILDNFSAEDASKTLTWLHSLRPQNRWEPSDEHYELEEFAKIVRGNLTGISEAVQELFEAKYLQLTGNKMYGGFKD